jgi:hypothetical protein
VSLLERFYRARHAIAARLRAFARIVDCPHTYRAHASDGFACYACGNVNPRKVATHSAYGKHVDKIAVNAAYGKRDVRSGAP